MKIELTERTIEKIAARVTDMLQERKSIGKGPEYVSCAEAAHLLRISPDRLRRIKHLFPHKKVTGKLLFDKNHLNL